MINAEQSLRRIRDHSGLEPEATVDNSLTIHGWSQLNRDASGIQTDLLRVMIDEIISCLQIVMDTMESTEAEGINRELSYGISGIQIRMLEVAMTAKDPSAARTVVLLEIWRLMFSWDQYLAGDIDNLAHDLALNEEIFCRDLNLA